ncbi:MAG: hypothetical protein PHZ00_04285 [Candidatus Peribacteraceae bacterium]|nr:hypothetical protein [Candidatus Peribacteraceae bacterium]
MMLNYLSLFRLSFAEGRLLHQKVETVPESLLQNYVEKLKNPAGCAEVMRDIGSKSDVLQTLRARLAGLRDQEKAAIDENLKAMQLKMDRNSPISKALDVLRGRVFQPAAQVPERGVAGPIGAPGEAGPAQLNSATASAASAKPLDVSKSDTDKPKTKEQEASWVGHWWNQRSDFTRTMIMGTGAFLLGRWLWNRLRGKKPDADQKAEPWGLKKLLLAIPIVGGLAWGIGWGVKQINEKIKEQFEPYKKIADYASNFLGLSNGTQNPQNGPGSTTKNPSGGGDIPGGATPSPDRPNRNKSVGLWNIGANLWDGTTEGIDTAGKNFGESFSNFGSSCAEVIKKNEKHEYSSPAEYHTAIAWAVIKDGAKVVFMDGACHLYKSGTKILSLGGELASGVFNVFLDLDGEGRGEHVLDVMKVYVGGVVVYASSFSVADFLWLRSDMGFKGALKQSAGRALAWPYEIYRKTGVKYGIAMLDPRAQGTIAKAEFETALRKVPFGFKRIKYGRLGEMFGSWEEVHLTNLFEEWRAYSRISHKVGKLQGAEALRTTVGNRMGMIEDQLSRGLEKYCKSSGGKIPQFITELDEPGDLIRQIERGQIADGFLGSKLQRASLVVEQATSGLAEQGVEELTKLVEEVERTSGRATGEAGAHTAEEGGAHARGGTHATSDVDKTHATRSSRTSPPKPGERGKAPTPGGRRPAAAREPALVGAETADAERAAVGGERTARPRGPAGTGEAVEGGGRSARAVGAAAAGAEPRGIEGSGRLISASLENAPEAWRSHKSLEALARSYKGETTAVFEAALKRVSSLTTSADDAVKLLQEANVVRILAHDSPILEQAFKISVQGQKNAVPAVRRLAAFIGCLGDKIKPSMLSEGIITRIVADDVSASAMQRVFSPKTLATLEAKLAAGGEEAAVEMIDQVAKHATRMSRIILGAGAALEAGMFLYDIYEYGQAKERAAAATKQLLQFLSGSDFVKVSNTDYRHKVTGQTFSIQETEKRIADMPTAELQRCLVDGGSAAFAGGAAVASIWAPAMASSVAMGPAGLVVMSVVLVSHGAIAISDAARKHAFVRDTPMAQLLEVGAEQLLGTTALEGAANASSWQFSGNERKMTQERKKFFMLMLVKNLREIEKTDPEFALEITGGKTMHQLVDESGELYRTDFDRIILPVMATRMFQQANDGTSHWSEFKHGKISEGSTDSTNIDIEDANLAMTDGLNFYRQHLRLKRKEAAEQELKQFTDGPTACANLTELDAQAKASANRQELEERAAALKAQTIFGAPADTVPPDASAQLIDAAVKKLDAATPIRTVQLPGGTFGPSQKTEETPQSDVKQEAFAITLPAFAFPDRKENRTMPLWKVAREAAKSDAEDPEARYDAFLQRARTILDLHAREVAQDEGLLYARSEQLSPHDREILGKYLQVLSEYPEFDEDGSMRKMLEPMQDKRIAGWKPMMLSASTLIDKPATYAKLERHLEQIESRYFKVHGVDRAGRPETKAVAGREQYLSNGSVRQWVRDIDRTSQGSIEKFSGKYEEVEDTKPMDTLYVVFGDREPIAIKANVPVAYGSAVLETIHTVDGLGTFTCTSKLQAPKHGAKSQPVFNWKFIGAYPGATCYYYTVDKNGIEKPGNNLTVEAQPSKEFVWNAVGGNSFTYRQPMFKATLFLKEGKGAPIEASTPPRQPAGSKVKRGGSIGGYVTVTQEGNGWKFSPDTAKAGDIDRIEVTSPFSNTKMIVRSVMPPTLTPPLAASPATERPAEEQRPSS